MSDIFKDMQVKVGCDYLSDLPSYKRKVWHEMKRLNPANYEERQLEDFSKYVFGIMFPCISTMETETMTAMIIWHSLMIWMISSARLSQPVTM